MIQAADLHNAELKGSQFMHQCKFLCKLMLELWGGSQAATMQMHFCLLLHGREALQPLNHIVQSLHDFDVSLDETRSMVGQIVLLAQGLDAHSSGCQAAARHAGKQVVLDLVVQAAHEPAVQILVMHVAGGGDLQHAKWGGALVVIQRHAIVPHAKGNADEKSTQGLGHSSECKCMRQRHAQQQGGIPHVVQNQASVLQQTKAQPSVEGALAPAQVQAEHEGKALLHPCKAGKAQEWQEQGALVLEVPSVGGCLLQELLAPCQQGHGVDIRVAIMGTISALVQVGDGVVRVVLVLPPGHAEALENVANQATNQVVGEAPAEDLQQKVSQRP